jgi:transposase-like protein
MPKGKQRRANSDATTDMIRDLMIVQMGLAGVGQREIRAIVGGSINDVNRIVKELRKSRRAKAGGS